MNQFRGTIYMTTPEIISDILDSDDDPPLTKKSSYRRWLASLDESELKEYYELVVAEHPKTNAG